MRVVLSGYFGHGNTGDEAILAGMLATMRAAAPDLEAVVISGDPSGTRRVHGVDAVPRMAPAAIWRALRGADGLVSGGGGLFQDRTSARPVAYYAGVTGLARLAARPYVIHAQGLGPILRRPNRALTAMALRGAASVSLRDEGSVRFARELGVRRPIALVPDPALALHPGRPTGRHILVAVRSWPGAGTRLAAVRDAIRALAADHEIVALAMHEPIDRDASAQVTGGIPGARIAAAGSLDDRLALIGSARLVVAMRLHALVLAAAAGVPAVAISYDPKVDAFAGRVGMPVAGDIAAPLEPARIVEAARRELEGDLGRRHALVEAMRDELRNATAEGLAALYHATTTRP
jgi:polysaccharide pyruvyl transferase CsaB